MTRAMTGKPVGPRPDEDAEPEPAFIGIGSRLLAVLGWLSERLVKRDDPRQSRQRRNHDQKSPR